MSEDQKKPMTWVQVQQDAWYNHDKTPMKPQNVVERLRGIAQDESFEAHEAIEDHTAYHGAVLIGRLLYLLEGVVADIDACAAMDADLYASIVETLNGVFPPIVGAK
jgi:hypothetical protein